MYRAITIGQLSFMSCKLIYNVHHRLDKWSHLDTSLPIINKEHINQNIHKEMNNCGTDNFRWLFLPSAISIILYTQVRGFDRSN